MQRRTSVQVVVLCGVAATAALWSCSRESFVEPLPPAETLTSATPSDLPSAKQPEAEPFAPPGVELLPDDGPPPGRVASATFDNGAVEVILHADNASLTVDRAEYYVDGDKLGEDVFYWQWADGVAYVSQMERKIFDNGAIVAYSSQSYPPCPGCMATKITRPADMIIGFAAPRVSSELRTSAILYQAGTHCDWNNFQSYMQWTVPSMLSIRDYSRSGMPPDPTIVQTPSVEQSFAAAACINVVLTNTYQQARNQLVTVGAVTYITGSILWDYLGRLTGGSNDSPNYELPFTFASCIKVLKPAVCSRIETILAMQ